MSELHAWIGLAVLCAVLAVVWYVMGWYLEQRLLQKAREHRVLCAAAEYGLRRLPGESIEALEARVVARTELPWSVGR